MACSLREAVIGMMIFDFVGMTLASGITFPFSHWAHIGGLIVF